MSDIENYKTAIAHLAKTNDKMDFNNSGVDHAAIVMSNIFKYASHDIYIYAHNLNGDISNKHDYFENIKNYINNSSRTLTVVLDESPINDGANVYAYLQNIIKKGSANVSLKKASPQFIDNVKKRFVSKQNNHFCVADSKMYRIETDQVAHKATCSFNRPEYAKLLEDIFKRNIDSCKSIPS